MAFNRRETLKLSLLAAGSSLVGCANEQVAHAPERASVSDKERFLHGVASGDPQTDSVVLWTRLETESAEEQLMWEVSETQDFSEIIQSGEAFARRENDHTVKVIAAGLAPGATYYYRFVHTDETSMTGRTRTLPEGTLDKLGIALASCSNFAFGFFNAYDAIAKDKAIDIVLHTGDYIYEYGAEGWGAETANIIGRVHEPAHEIVSLDDYRIRHAQYKRDAGSIAMHAAHPVVACWDDHESTNNPWQGGAQNHQPDTEGDWAERRTASVRAYFEWMPIREPEDGQTREEFWRTYRFGDLATLVTLETRHTARGEQVDYSQYHEQIASREDRDAFMQTVINDPTRRMISEGMEAEIRAAFSASLADGQAWRMFGNASPIARMLVPDVLALGIDPASNSGGQVPGGGPDIFWKGKWNLPFYTDTWDGYPAARQSLYALCQSVGAHDLLFLTGDSHSFWANRLFDDAGMPMGLELGTAGISSPGDFVESGWDAASAQRLDQLFAEQLEEVVWTDNMHQGYVRVELDRERAAATFVAVDTVLSPDYKTIELRQVKIAHTGSTIDYV